MSFRGRLRRLDDKLERVKAVRGRAKEWPADPIEFCVQFLGFEPTVYQEKLLQDPAQLPPGAESLFGPGHLSQRYLLRACCYETPERESVGTSVVFLQKKPNDISTGKNTLNIGRLPGCHDTQRAPMVRRNRSIQSGLFRLPESARAEEESTSR